MALWTTLQVNDKVHNFCVVHDIVNDKQGHNIVNESFAHKQSLLVTWGYHATHWLAAAILPLLLIFECRKSNLERFFV